MALSITAELGGIEPRDPSKQYEDLPGGVYKVKTVTAEEYTSTKGNKSAKLVFEVTDGALKGKKGEIYLGLDFTKEGNKRSLLGALLSHGAKKEKIPAQGAVTVTDANFVNRAAFVFVREVDGSDDQGRKKLNDKEYIRGEDYETLAKTPGAGASKANGAASPTPAAAGAIPPAGAPGASLFD